MSDDDIKVSWKTFPLTDPTIEAVLSSKQSIMLHKSDRLTFGKNYGHYKVRRDDHGWHIRIGKRGMLKCYLTRCEVTYLDGVPTLYQFRTKA